MTAEGWIFVVPELADQVSAQLAPRPAGQIAPPHLRILDLDALKGVARSSRMLAAVAAGIACLGILDPEALVAAAGELGATYAQANQDAVRAALEAIGEVVREARTVNGRGLAYPLPDLAPFRALGLSAGPRRFRQGTSRALTPHFYAPIIVLGKLSIADADGM